MGPQEISLLSRVCAAPMTVSGHPRHFERAPALPVYSQHRKYRCVAADRRFRADSSHSGADPIILPAE
jgi:hypothetical protein